MATNKNALIRYKHLDMLLSDRHHYYDINDLTERVNTKGLNETLFCNTRTFYKLYPQIRELFEICATPSHKLTGKIHPMASYELENGALGIHPTPSDELITPQKTIIERHLFSHLYKIMTQKDSLDARQKVKVVLAKKEKTDTRQSEQIGRNIVCLKMNDD
jgi:hypothetical protein